MVFVFKAKKPSLPKQVAESEDVLATHAPAYVDAMRKYAKGLARLAAKAPLSKDGKSAAAYMTTSAAARQLLNVLREDLEDAYSASAQAGAEHGLKIAGLESKMVVTKATSSATRGRAKRIALPMNAEARKWIATRSSNLIVQITEDVRTNVRKIISDGYSQNLHPDTMRTKIGQAVGLNDRLAGAVSKRYDATYNASVKAGIPEDDARDRAKEVSDDYADDLMDYRGEMIARTEGKWAQNRAQEDSWREADEQGLMPEGAKKQWITLFDERTAPECKRLDGQIVGLDETFDSEDYGKVARPPLFPNCRCTIGLVFE